MAKLIDEWRLTIKKKDWTPYIGKKYNRLEVLDIRSIRRGNKQEAQFLCRCDCENKKWINSYNVIRGISKSCGCGERESRYGRRHAKDITRQRFGRLVVVEDSGKRSANGSVIWTCSCDCGGTIEVSSGDLKRRRVTNCGCEKTHANTKDIRGVRFGKLTVIEVDRERSHTEGSRVHWVCRCDCGEYTSVATSCLTSEGTLSCGCTQMSYHEQMIASYLDDLQINYVRQKKFDDCKNVRPLPFDFYLTDLNIAIEYDGRQHYEPVKIFGGVDGLLKRKENDSIKSTYCKDKNIELIRLPYTMSCKEIQDILFTLGTRNE